MRQSLGREKHVLGAAKPYAKGARRSRVRSILRSIGVGTDWDRALFHGPSYDRIESLVFCPSNLKRQLSCEDTTCGSVKREPISFLEDEVTDSQDTCVRIHVHVFGRRDAALAHAAGHHRSVTCSSSASGEETNGGRHTVDVVCGRLLTHEDDRVTIAPGGSGDGCSCRKRNPADCRTWRSR